jgi:phosphate transport system substrate-binding protein
MRRRTLAVAALLALSLAIPASAGAKTLIGSGSVAAQPFLLSLFKAYHKVQPKIKFVYTANGGNAGVQDVQQGRSQFAGQARPPLPSDSGTTYVKVFLDGLCIDVNPQNTLSNITIPDLRNVYLGNTTNWGDVPGSSLATTIAPYGRDTNGGTYNFFKQAVLNGQNQAGNVNALPSDGQVANAVKNDANGIGYIGLAWQGAGLRKLQVNSIPCAPKYIAKLAKNSPGAYPLSRFLWIVLPNNHPSRDVQKFADWVRTSKKAAKVITKRGGVPLVNRKR